MASAVSNQDKPVVLLATQSRLSAKSMIKLLQSQFCVVEAEDAEKTWDALTGDSNFKLLIADLSIMSNEFCLVERLKSAQDENIRTLPILLLVKEDDEDSNREQALSDGANDFINLPFSSSELMARARMHTHVLAKEETQVIDVGNDESADILQQMAQESFYESRLQQELSFSSRHKIPVSSCKIEVNGLDEIENNSGHELAHQIIKLFAKILQKTIRREDTVSYSGHGRFILLYPATNALGALAAINRIKKAVAKSPVKINDTTQDLTFSGAIYTCLASESITTESIQKELESRLKDAMLKGAGEIITSGHKEKDSNEITPSLERALILIDDDNTADLEEHSKALMLRIIPLLRFSNENLSLGMEKVIDSLIQRLKKR